MNAKLVIGWGIPDHIVMVIAVQVSNHQPGCIGAGWLPRGEGNTRLRIVCRKSEGGTGGARRCGGVTRGKVRRTRKEGKISVAVVVNIAFCNGVNVAHWEKSTRQIRSVCQVETRI